MEIQKIKIGQLDLPQIITDIGLGRLRIPQFQRDYVWEKSKTISLLNSIYNEFPIGSFFLWDAPKKYNNFYRQIEDFGIIKQSISDNFSFILDGQQRLTSIYAAVKGLKINGRDYSTICLDLDGKVFKDIKPDDERYVALRDFFGETSLEIFSKLTDERKKVFQKCVNTFQKYPFSAIEVKEKELEDVCDIFELINQGGKRLSLFDLIVASTWSEEFDLRQKINELNKKIDGKGFGKLDYEIFTQCLSLIKKGSCTRTAQLQLRTNDIEQRWSDIVKSTELALDYIQSNLGVKHVQYLPYRAIMTLLAYFFYSKGNKAATLEQRRVIEKWFWRSTFSERYGVHTQATIAEDKRRIFDKLIAGEEPTVNFKVTLTAKDLMAINMGKKSAIKSGFLCILALKQPNHFYSNANLLLQDNYFSTYNSPEKHHIFPKGYLNKNNIWEFNRIPNFCFIPSELNKDILDNKPSKYFKIVKEKNPEFRKVLNTHLIPSGKDSGIWNDDYWLFLNQRAELIMKEISKLVS